jgi:5-methylcytosine-specific restriction endonuclease McrA
MSDTQERLQRDGEDALIAEAEAKEAERHRRERVAWAKAVVEAPRDATPRTGLSRDVQVAVFERDGGRCVACGSTRLLQFDHVIPLAMGGSNSIDNLQVLCDECNRRKGGTLG